MAKIRTEGDLSDLITFISLGNTRTHAIRGKWSLTDCAQGAPAYSIRNHTKVFVREPSGLI